MYAISINYSRTYLQLSVRAVFTMLIMTQGLKSLRYYLSKSEFSVKKQLMMKNIGKHTVKKMRELRYEVIKN